MRIEFQEKNTPKADTAFIFAFQGEDLGPQAQNLDSQTHGYISKSIEKNKKFVAKFGQTLTLSLDEDTDYDRVIVFGLGQKDAFSSEQFLVAGGKAFNVLKNNSVQKCDIFLSQDALPPMCEEENVNILFAEGLSLKNYRFDKYKTNLKSSPVKLDLVSIVTNSAKSAAKAFEASKHRVEGVNWARDLVTEPANMLYPESFADRIVEELKPLGVKVTVIDDKKLEKMGAGALMAVGQGALRKPRLVIMEYNGVGKSSKKPSLAMAGKGVTFDTGGINLKSDSPMFGIYDMKFDMGGAAAIVGAFKSLAGRKAKTHVVAAVALAENSVSANAFLPSDVIKSLSGKTVEITNTDAEGRLVLVDAIWYLQEKYDVDTIIDLATLTGSIIVALGLEYGGVFTDDDDIWENLNKAGNLSQEHLWRMPMNKAWEKDIDSDIADTKNRTTSGAAGASSKAAQFIRRFIQDGVTWAHLDIAGPVWSKSEKPLSPKGATGYGVRLLDTYIAQNFEK